jgi:DNA replication protein DnaC
VPEVPEILTTYSLFKKTVVDNLALVPWCKNCDWGRILIPPKEVGFFPTTKQCDCYKRVEYLERVINIFQRSNMDIWTIIAYPLEKYKEDTVPLKILRNLLFTDETKNWMYLYWTPGTGKTYTAIVIFMFALMLQRDVLYMNVPKLMDDLRPSTEDRGKEWMTRCIEAELLILDDIGQEKPSERVKERLYIIINERYMARRITIFTSNTPLDGLHTKLNHLPIISRLKHYCATVDFTSTDKRF